MKFFILLCSALRSSKIGHFVFRAHRKLIKRRVSDVNLTADVTADVTGAWTMFNNYDFGDLYISPDVEVKDDDLMSRSQVDEEPPVVVEFTVKHVNVSDFLETA